MGCWNETCGVTNLPINVGDKVRLLLLINNNYNINPAGFSYSTDTWEPLYLPIRGKYNDYGGIDEIEHDWNVEFIEGMLSERVIEKDIGKNEIHDIAVMRDDLNIYKIQESIHKGRLEVKNIFGKPTNVGYMFILEDVWQYMISLNDNTDSFYKDCRKEGIDYISRYKESILNKRTYNVRIRICDDSSFTRAIENYFRNFNIYLDLCYDYIIENEDPTPIIDQISDLIIFNVNLESLRKHYAPQSGKGSQDADYDSMINLCEFIISHAKGKKKEFDIGY